MRAACLLDGDWSSVIGYLESRVDLEGSARRYGALRRVRKVRDAAQLLRLAMLYGPGQLSLRSTAAMALDAGLPALSDKAVLGRLRRMGDWLSYLLATLLADKCGLRAAGELGLALVDGSVVCSPGGRGAAWRLHARFDPGRGGFTDLVLTTAAEAERSDRTRIAPGETLIQDRGYARVRNFTAILDAGADFITRLGWRSLSLRDAEGRPIALLAHLPEADLAEHTVYLRDIARPLRLVIARLPPDQAARQRRRVARKSGKAGRRMDPRTATAAGYLMLLTSLPDTQQPAARIVALYRQRWQVELGFKRLKTLGGLDRLPATDPALARTWLLAHLIAAVLIQEIAHEIVGFPPSEA